MASTLSAFPFLTAGDFDEACRDLADRACTCAAWSSLRLVTQVTSPRPLHSYGYGGILLTQGIEQYPSQDYSIRGCPGCPGYY